MNATIAALLGSLIGAVTGLAGSVLSSVVALKNARQSEESNARTEYIRTLRERSGTTFAQFFIMVQAIEWIAWHGMNEPHVDKKTIESYDEGINSTYQALLGAMAMTASLNLTIYRELRPTLLKLYGLEERVAVAIRQAESHRNTAVPELRTCKSEAEALREYLPIELNRIMVLAQAADVAH